MASTSAREKPSFDWKYLFSSFDGRINRKPFWIGGLILLIVSVVVQIVAQDFAGEAASLIVGLLFIYPGFALSAKRGHDRNRPTWLIGLFYSFLLALVILQVVDLQMRPDGEPSTPFLILALLLVAAWIFFVIDLGFLRGTPGDNNYGPDPLAAGGGR